MNQCWNIVNWTLGNRLQWNLNRNSYIFIQENAFENVVYEMAAIFSRLQFVNGFKWWLTNLLLRPLRKAVGLHGGYTQASRLGQQFMSYTWNFRGFYMYFPCTFCMKCRTGNFFSLSANRGWFRIQCWIGIWPCTRSTLEYNINVDLSGIKCEGHCRTNVCGDYKNGVI